MPYAALAKVFALIEATTKRLEKTSLLTSFLLLVIQRSAKGDTKSLLQTVYLCINRVSRVQYVPFFALFMKCRLGSAMPGLYRDRARYRRESAVEGDR